MPRTVFSITSLVTACLAAACFAPPVLAQGALKPLEAVIVNPESRPVPVADKALLEVARAILEATRASDQTTQPYQQTTQSIVCGSHACTATFAVVPAGKRLVVTHVSAQFALPGVDGFPSVALTTSSLQSPPRLLFAPTNHGPGSYILSSPVTFYVEAGVAPVLVLGGNNAGFSTNTRTAAVVGHLVNAH